MMTVALGEKVRLLVIVLLVGLYWTLAKPIHVHGDGAWFMDFMMAGGGWRMRRCEMRGRDGGRKSAIEIDSSIWREEMLGIHTICLDGE